MTDQEQQLMKRLEDLCQYIRDGKIIEAMHEFYDENVEMQENLEPPCVGLEANIQREEEWLASVKEFKSYEVQALARFAHRSGEVMIFRRWCGRQGRSAIEGQLRRGRLGSRRAPGAT
ncbi:MAG: hypothetical protein PVG82_04800 [Chromatiales bacterium]